MIEKHTTIFFVSPRSSMDRTWASGAQNVGSIPAEGTWSEAEGTRGRDRSRLGRAKRGSPSGRLWRRTVSMFRNEVKEPKQFGGRGFLPKGHKACIIYKHMSLTHHHISIPTTKREELIDITDTIQHIVAAANVEKGLATMFVQGSTAAIMIQENWDNTVQTDVVDLFQKLVPRGVWKHDEHDGNGDAHLKAGIVGPSKTIPIQNGRLALGRWQNLFLCEFDGPREKRPILISIFN